MIHFFAFARHGEEQGSILPTYVVLNRKTFEKLVKAMDAHLSSNCSDTGNLADSLSYFTNVSIS